MFSVDRINGFFVDTADTRTLSGGSSNSNVTVFTPTGTPRVLDNPRVSIITNSEDAVIQISTATTGNDTRGVELESLLVSFDTNWNGFLVKSNSQLVGAVRSNLNEALGFEDNLRSIICTLLVNTLVRIVSFSFNTVLDDVFVSRR